MANPEKWLSRAKNLSESENEHPSSKWLKRVENKKQESGAFSNAAQYLKEDAANLGKNLLAGYLNLGRGLANTPHRLGNLVGLGETFGELAPENFNYAESLGLSKPQENKLIQAVPEVAASFAIPGSTIPRMIAGQAAFGATQNENPLIGAAEGGIGAGLGALVGKGIEKGINALRPSKLLRGELSPEELLKNVKNVEGTETPLGQIIDNPWLNRLSSNVLPHILGSGAEKTAQKTANKVTEKGEEILSGLRNGEEVHENYGERLRDALKESFKRAENTKNAKFNKVNDLAETHGITTTRENLRKEADSILSQIKNDPDLAQFTNKGDISLLEDLAGKTKKAEDSLSNNVSVITGKPIPNRPKNFSLKNTDILRGKIGENAYEANVKGEKPKAAIYARLKKALEEDVSKAIESAPNEEIKNAHKEAMDFYKNEFSPFKDKNITKFVKGEGDPDLILSHFLKMGKNDRVNLSRSLSTKLQNQPNLMLQAYLSPAYENGKLNPIKLSALYHKLGKRQALDLFGKENNEILRNYADLVHKNKEGFNLMFNPKTGARLGHVGQVVLGGAHLPSALGAAGISNIANRLLTNESFRKKLIDAMVKDKNIEIPAFIKNLQKASSAGAQQQNK